MTEGTAYVMTWARVAFSWAVVIAGVLTATDVIPALPAHITAGVALAALGSGFALNIRVDIVRERLDDYNNHRRNYR